ncbi:tRNA-dihydrouridine synthase [Pseudarthrobacter sp. H2]|uniref:oxidoreductase n=1 Tax=Pseudarthrobacter sp. H2 TaxID=3418415 RepID=UPI003CE83A28
MDVDLLTENPEDPREGWTGEDTVRLSKELLEHGVDLLDVSTGGMVPGAWIFVEPHYQVPFAHQVRDQTGMPTAAVGMITNPHQAEEILISGQADAILLGRELLRNPYWARHAAHTLEVDPDWPEQYGYAVKQRKR